MVAAAGLLFLFLFIAAVAVEVGMWLHAKRDAQNDVDASVLAGAQELPDEGIASAVAEAWGTRNGTTGGELVCCEFEDLTGDGEADLIRARVERQPESVTGNLLDVGIVTVTAKAAAAKQRAVASCVVPWAILGDQALGPGGYWGLDPEELYIFHTSEFFTPGNFGALRLYGNGTPAYKAAITTPCGTSGKGCAQGQPIGPGETLECEVETGNMGGNTHDALTERDENFGIVDSSSCDAATLAEAVEKAESECGLSRVVPIPIIDAWPSHGHDSVQIFGLATFYIAGWDRTPPYKGQDMDGDTLDDMVWGYFLQDQPITEAWNIQWGYSDDPFAPTRVLLVE